jgi:hypothetical protein
VPIGAPCHIHRNQKLNAEVIKRRKSSCLQRAKSLRHFMTAILAKTISHKTVGWCYALLISLTIAFSSVSSYSMYRHALTPACMDGTTSTPYSGPTAPNAPNAESPPFCSSDVLNAYQTVYYYYSYTGVELFSFDAFQQRGTSFFYPFESLGPNSTCPTLSSENADSLTVIVQGSALSSTASQETSSFRSAVHPANRLLLTVPFRNHNLPFQLPDSTTTYYARNFVDRGTSFGFEVATSNSAPALSAEQLQSTFGSAIFRVKLPFASQCASQFQKTYRPGPAGSINNVDGTLKAANGGICLTQETQTGVQISIPGLIGSALAFSTLLWIALDFPFVRKFRLFNVLFISINALSIIFLIAALALGATMFTTKVAPCVVGSDFSNESVMPAPRRAAINGFTPSSGGFDMSVSRTQAAGLFQTTQAGNAAVYMKPSFRPTSGAGFGIAALVFQFLFTVVFALKVDWTDSYLDVSANSNL